MAGRKGNFSSLYCSFCGKSQDEVRKLIAGPTVYICDECIELCNEIIAEEYQKEEIGRSTAKVPTPSEIKKALDDYVIGQNKAKKIFLWPFITTTSASSPNPTLTEWSCKRATSS